MKKPRNISAEVIDSIRDFKQFHAGKITLRTHAFKKKPRPNVTPQLIRALREKLHLSRQVFALKFRVSPRTLEKWEQGETVPNDQAAALMLLIKKYPDTLERLANI